MRYYVVPQKIHQKTVNFNEEQMHHMRKVLRYAAGSIIEVFDNKGNVYDVEVAKLSRDASFGKIIKTKTYDLVNKKRSTLIQSFPSALPKLDLVIEKGTELGIDTFIFYKSKRSELIALPSEEKQKRWKRIAVKASEQSLRYTLPDIYCINSLDELDYSIYEQKFVLYEKSENSTDLSNFTKSQSTVCAIGPEGGWEESEIENFSKLGFTNIKLYSNILRTETAAISAASLMNLE